MRGGLEIRNLTCRFYQKLFKFYRTAITVKSPEENASVDKMRRVSKTKSHTASCARKIWTLENITKEQNLWCVKCEILFSTRGMWFTVLTVVRLVNKDTVVAIKRK